MIAINGLVLPTSLVELLTAGRWKCPADTRHLREWTGLVDDSDDLHFCTAAEMQEYTDGFEQDYAQPGKRATFGLESSRRTGGAVALPLLDIDKAVMIAMTYGDGMLCLDYRDRPEQPSVVVSDWDAPGPCRWRVLAPDIETFASVLHL